MKTKAAKVNKSAAIREYIADNPDALAGEVVSMLGKHGIKIVPNQVYGIKAELVKRKSGVSRNGNGKPHRNGNSTAVTLGTFEPTTTTWTGVLSNGPSDAVALVRRTKELADDCGGMEKLKELVGVLAE